MVLLSVYFFQPILVFWGLTSRPIDYELLATPLAYISIVLICLFFIFIFSRFVFSNKQKQSIYLAVSLVGNTGNIGIPLGIALFGLESVAYTSIINIANIFFMYTFTAYFFAREEFDIKSAIFSIMKIPAIWFAFLALLFSYFGIKIEENIYKALEMGSYTSMVIQLIIFGIYLSKVKIKTMPWHLSLHISFVKHLALPILGVVFILYFTNLSTFIASILIMELIVPLAVNNVNIAALYNCKPNDVAATVLVSSSVFVLLLPVYMYFINYFIG